jgi:Leucine-rich repeat (LRR) protein
MSILCIPHDLLYFVANFLLAEPEQNKLIFKFSRNWRNFMNTSKQYFAGWKHHSQVVTLQGLYADIFFTYPRFRERISRSVKNLVEQLEIDYRWSSYEVNEKKQEIDLGNVKGLKRLMIADCAVTNLPYVSEEILLRRCKISPVQDLAPRRFEAYVSQFSCADSVINWIKSIEEVTLTHLDQNYACYAPLTGSIAVRASPSITDVTCFQNVKILKFCYCDNITDVSSLGNVYELSLSHCIGVTDVSALGKVYNLDLSGCCYVTDVSALGNVHTLNLRGCSVTDVSALGNVHTLSLDGCDAVTDLSALKNVKEFSFRSFDGDDLSDLQNVEKLSIVNAFSVSDISMLKKVKELNIHGISHISSFHGLTNLRKLEIGEFDPDGDDGPLPFSINSGVEVFNNLTELITNDICGNDSSFFTFVSDDYSDDSSDDSSVCHFKNLVHWSLDR